MLNDNFWIDFLADSDSFKKPLCIKNVFSDDIEELKKLYFCSFKKMTNEEVSPYGIWLDGGNRNEIKGMIAEGIKKPEFENLDDFCTNFFEGYSFGVVAHHTNAYNMDLATKFYSYLLPLYESLGVGLKGVDLNVFMGNYGWTPFGIHQDGAGENVIHFHLGPGTKTMYLWSPENYPAIEELELEEKILQADFVFEIHAGDLFFMPEGYYHIGYTPDYSTAITSWFCSPPVKTFREKIISGLFDFNLKEEVKAGNAFKTAITDAVNITYNATHNFSNILESFYGSMSIEDAINLRIRQHVFALKSSLYYTWPILLLDNESSRRLVEHNRVKINTPFQIGFFTEEQIGRIFVYACGHEMIHVAEEEIAPLIQLLNEGEIIEINKLTTVATMNVLNFLYQSRGIVLVD